MALITTVPEAAVLVGMLAFGHVSADHAMWVWATRLLISIPIDMWMLRRVSGLGYEQQLRGALLPTLAATAMGGIMLLIKHVLFGDMAPELRLWPIALIGVAVYVLVIVLIDREQFKQVVNYVGQTLQTRG